MLFKLTIPILACIIYLVPIAVFSKCSKQDIEFYLEKGFTPEQITQLCATSEASVPDYTPYQQQVVIYGEGEAPGSKDGLTKEAREAIKTLKKGTDVYNFKVDENKIYFTRRVCLVTGQAKDVERRYRDCPIVDFTIARENLKVESAGKKFGIFGKGSVTLKGTITPVLQGSFEDYPVEFRQGLERNFNWKESEGETDIPVKGDFSITAVANAFQELSSDSVSEFIPGESSLDEYRALDADEALGEELPEQPVRKASAKKKKKWWNPFD